MLFFIEIHCFTVFSCKIQNYVVLVLYYYLPFFSYVKTWVWHISRIKYHILHVNFKFYIMDKVMVEVLFKNPAYGRHWIPRQFQIEAPIQNGWKWLKTFYKNNWERLKIDLTRNVEGWQQLKMIKNGWKLWKTVEISPKWLKMV